MVPSLRSLLLIHSLIKHSPRLAYAPAWAVDRTLILIDSRSINGAVFCLAVAPRLNRESLCAAAGQPIGPDIQGYVQGLPWALAAWQQVDLATGSTVTLL